MTVLVTGGAGYIGGHMVLGLMDAGEKVVVLDNLSTGFAWAVPEGVELVVGDFGDAELVSRLIATRRIDAIAHFAAKIVVPESVTDPLGYYLNNTCQCAHADRMRGQRRRQAFHLLLDRRRLWRDGVRAGDRDDAAQPDLALWPLEADGRVDAGGRRARLRFPLCGAALFQRRRRRSAGAGSGRRPRWRRI